MILTGARIATGAASCSRADLIIRYGRVSFKSKARVRSESAMDLSGCLILPGLINAHDHLEFNLFPRIGRGPYHNAVAWARDIFHPAEPPIAQQLSIPKAIRLWWGGLKNLLNGVTSVAHHNFYDAAAFKQTFPVRVVKRYGWAHSLAFSRDVTKCFRQTPSGAPFIIHAAEGTDQESAREVHVLDAQHVLSARTVVVHGVAVGPEELEVVKSRRTSLIWCPSSNLFTLGRTLSTEILRSGIPIALGSDSALTAEGDFLDECRVASSYVSLRRVYEMVTTYAATILRLQSGEGKIQEGGLADLLVIQDRDQEPPEALVGVYPELVFLRGRIKLVSPSMAARLGLSDARFQSVEVEGRGRWLVEGNVREMLALTKQTLGADVCLAGRKVTA